MNFSVEPQKIPDCLLLRQTRFCDTRGFFSEMYHQKELESLGLDVQFVQDNLSYSIEAYTLRGMHYQKPPYEQGKYVTCLQGKILDVVVDFRKGSPTFLESLHITLESQSGQMLYVPPGCLHGFLTLEPHTFVLYKVTNYYAKEYDAGIFYNDPQLNLAWPLEGRPFHLSAKDSVLPRLDSVTTPFTYEKTLCALS